MASPTPVLPEVGSTIVPPGLSFPSRLACSIIGRPIRSFTEPPGFRYSSLASSAGPTSWPTLSSRTIGVAPTRSSRVGYSRATPLESLDRDPCGFALPDVLRAHSPQQDERRSRAGEREREERPETVLEAGGQEAERLGLRAWVLAGSRRREDGRHDGHADRPPDLLARVQQSRGQPRFMRCDAG